jgi:RimJ/RimL family protein N-acetyltransferase
VDHLELRHFEREQLALVEPWFSDDETQRWLGGPDWPRLMVDLGDRALGEFRGANETGRFRWLGWEGGDPVGYIDCGTFDRWTTWDNGAQGPGVVATMEQPSAAIAFVVDPARRRRGYAGAMITRLLAQPELHEVTLFGAGVEPDNLASVRALIGAGFHPLDPEPDFEGIIYFVRHRRVDAARAAGTATADLQLSPARASGSIDP